MAERDQLRGPLRRHDPRQLRGRQGVALRKLAELPRRLRRHADLGRRDRAPTRGRLVADVHHADCARRVDVRETAHAVDPSSAAKPRPRAREAPARATSRGRARERARGSPSIRRRRSASLELEREVDRAGLARDVERVDAEREVAELVVRAGVLGQHEHPVARVDERRLLRDEVQPVEDGVHEQHVVLLVRRDGAGEVVLDAQVDRHPTGARVPVVHAARLALDRAEVLGVLGDVLARRVEQREHPDSLRASRDARRGRARTHGTRARRSSTDPCDRRGRSASRAGSPRARAPPRGRLRSRRARRTRARRRRSGSR